MGLSDRKVKQRITKDPRNLTWVDDASRFGAAYLSKFGWDSSKGLGAEGEGRTSHIKVSHKLDQLGIGAAHQRDPNGIAWKQNKDFENLLARLNNNGEQTVVEKEIILSGFHRPKEVEESLEKSTGTEDGNLEENKNKKKRRRGDDGNEEKSKSNKEKKSKKSEYKETQQRDVAMVVDPPIPVVSSATKFVPRHRAHRSRAMVAKSMSSKSAAHISEILGIAPSSSTASPGSATTQNLLTSTDNDKITTSTKSIAEYFKDKFSARSLTTPPLTRIHISAQAETNVSSEYTYDTLRGGIGSARHRLETQQISISVMDGGTQNYGISKFASLTSSSFLNATPSSTTLSASPAPIFSSLWPLSKLETPDAKSFEHSESNDDSKKNKRERKKSKETAAAEENAKSEKKKKDKKIKSHTAEKESRPLKDPISTETDRAIRKREKAERKARKPSE